MGFYSLFCYYISSLLGFSAPTGNNPVLRLCLFKQYKGIKKSCLLFRNGYGLLLFMFVEQLVSYTSVYSAYNFSSVFDSYI